MELAMNWFKLTLSEPAPSSESALWLWDDSVTCADVNTLAAAVVVVVAVLVVAKLHVGGLAGLIFPAPLFENVGGVSRLRAEVPRFNPY